MIFGVRAFTAILREHGSLFANRVFATIQVAGIAFNLAVLLCSTVLLTFTDRAFGWQSSWVSSPAQVENVVYWTSTPWRVWLPASVSYPSNEEIMGSKIILREPRSELVSENLLAWWPFLMLCVVFYGLIPRLFAWFFSLWNENRMLANLRFESLVYDPLIQRMKSIELNSYGVCEDGAVQKPIPLSDDDGRRNPAGVECLSPRVILLEDTTKRYNEESLKVWLNEQLGHAVEQLLTVNRIEEFGTEDVATIPLLLEGWQPPIQEILHQLSKLASKLKETDRSLLLILIGKPSREKVLPLSDNMMQVWRKKIQLLGCRNLSIFTPQSLPSVSSK